MKADESIHVWRYTLRSRLPLNARTSRREFPGALLRVDDGFGCLHPWPELGDAPLEAHLESLRAGRPTALAKRTLDCAALDGAARWEGRWLFEALTVPASHVIAGSIPDERLAEFPAVKVKCGANAEAEALARIPGERLRLDFNGSLDADAYRRFLGKLAPETKARIDFIEDPVPYDARLWAALPGEVPLAVDRGSETATDGFAFRVVKPAVQEMRDFPEPVVITSSMDHPLGQVFAAYEAAVYRGPLHGAGLLTHWCFEPDAFSEALSVEGARLVPPRGTGLGFDELLGGLSWSRL